MKARVVSVNVSHRKGVKKSSVDEALLTPDHGIEDDAHAGDWHRQVSLLASESIDKMRRKGLELDPGDFAENITTRDIDLVSLPVGSRVRIGEEVLLEVSQIGKECHERCAIYYQAGDCVMPREGIFAKVLKGGRVKKGDALEVLPAEADNG
jgi:cyclic pyranopterin phosphate synthase